MKIKEIVVSVAWKVLDPVVDMARDFTAAYRPERDDVPAYSGMATLRGVRFYQNGMATGASLWWVLVTGVVVGVCFSLIDFTQAVAPGYSMLVTLIGLCVFKASPMSTWHAAEHMVINYVEGRSGSVVTAPMIHRRCGTNLVVMATFLLCFAVPLYQAQASAIMKGVIIFAFVKATPTVGKYVGALAQYIFFLRTPNRKQLLDTANWKLELDAKVAERASLPGARPIMRLGQYLWMSGFLMEIPAILAVHHGLNFLITKVTGYAY